MIDRPLRFCMITTFYPPYNFGGDGILVHQLDYRYQPCNFVEIMPRLDEHLRRPKAKGAKA